VAETRYRDSSGLPVRNRSPGGWGGGGQESRARPSFPISIRYKRDGVRIRVNPLLCGTLATFCLMAVRLIQWLKRATLAEKICFWWSHCSSKGPFCEKMATFYMLKSVCTVSGNDLSEKRANLWPQRSDMATSGVIGTAMKRPLHRHPKHPDQRTLMPLTPYWHTLIGDLSTFLPNWSVS
jgi:hypothetical protein